jgi:SAM-dependent methyltransferase
MAFHSLAKYCDVDQAHVVEVGIGPLGFGLVPFLPRDPSRVPIRIGIDPLPQMKVPLAKSIPPVTFVQARGERLPFPDELFQIAVCYNVLDHCDNPLDVLCEIARSLDTGGVLYLTADTCSLLFAAKHKIHRILQPNAYNVILHPHVFLQPTVHRLLVASGFRVLETLPSQARFIHLLQALLGRTRRLTYIAKKL